MAHAHKPKDVFTVTHQTLISSQDNAGHDAKNATMDMREVDALLKDGRHVHISTRMQITQAHREGVPFETQIAVDRNGVPEIAADLKASGVSTGLDVDRTAAVNLINQFRTLLAKKTVTGAQISDALGHLPPASKAGYGK